MITSHWARVPAQQVKLGTFPLIHPAEKLTRFLFHDKQNHFRGVFHVH